MIEELKQLLRQFSMKGWLLYYSEKRKNGKNREQLQSTPPTSKIKRLSKHRAESGKSKKFPS